MAEAILGGFVKEGERLELDSDGEGGVILKNQKGKKRTHVPTAAQGIEEDMSGGFEVKPESDGTIRVTKPVAMP